MRTLLAERVQNAGLTPESPLYPRSQIVAAAGYSSSTLVQADTSGGSIQIPVSILANGPDPCPS